MAHFAKIDENNIVQDVIVISNEDCGFLEFPESEPVGQAYIASCGIEGNWLQTSYNTFGNQHSYGKDPFRANYATRGSIYDPEYDVFYSPQHSRHATLDLNTFLWILPPNTSTQVLERNQYWKWDDDSADWIIVSMNKTPPPNNSTQVLENNQFWSWNNDSGSWVIDTRDIESPPPRD